MDRKTLLAFLFSLAACGAVETGGPPDTIDHSGPDGGGATSPDPIPDVAPTVVAVDPPSGSRVTEDVAIAIRFSEPMDPASVEAALGFPGSAAPAFSWSPDGTEVTVSGTVPYPEGSSAQQVEPADFEVELAAAAADQSGDSLDGVLTLQYTLRYRRITQAFPFSQTLSGNCFLPCSGTWTWVVSGENSSDTTVTNRGFLTIPFNLPADISVEAAVLHTEVEAMTGNPFGELGDLLVDDVLYDAIDDNSLYARANGLGALLTEAQHPGVGTTASFDLTDAFADDYEHRAERSSRTQLRLRFLHDSPEDPSYDSYHADGNQDVVRLLRDETRLRVTYLIE